MSQGQEGKGRRGPRWPSSRDPRARDRDSARAGRYVAECGISKKQAAAQELSVRRLQQIQAGSHPGVPQRMQDWVDRLVDAGLDPRPLVVMMLSRIEERTHGEGKGPLEPWEALCDRETRKQGRLDLLQLALRAERDPELLEEFLEVAGRKVTVILRMMGLAEAELAGSRR